MYIKCIECGKIVSTEVPDNTVLRAVAICPECIEKDDSQGTRLPTLDEAEKRIQKAPCKNSLHIKQKMLGMKICPRCGEALSS